MRIAEAASSSGLSIDAIRYYEKFGIIPELSRGPDGQRRFSPENVDWLTLLYWLRQTGMPLKTMQRFGALYQDGDETIPERRAILLAHARTLQERRSDLDRCEEILAYKIRIYDGISEQETRGKTEMKVIVIGASGDIGRVVCAELADRHEVVTAGRNSGDIQVDIGDPASIAAMYEQTGKVDAVITTVGNVHFGPLTELTHDQFMVGLNNKVMGQVNIVLLGLDHIADGGSFTLTSGVLDRDPIRSGVCAATANGALGGFVTGAAIEMPRGIRLNVVSPGMLDVSAGRYGSFFPGHKPVASKDVALAYVKSLEGALTGQVLIVE
jgi:DNA-binding transcriptional MerR regulator